MSPEVILPKDRICVALDVGELSEARSLIEKLTEYVGYFKIGFQLFTSQGPHAVATVNDLGGKVFLDLKFHDIPNTVAQAASQATELRVAMLNLHATGGFEMMQKAVTAVSEKAKEKKIIKPAVLAVTVLTSLDERIVREELRVAGGVREQVVHLAKLAMSAGVEGVIASPQELGMIREACGRECLIVTPGVRPVGSAADDQKRVMTPREAIAAGADILVIGRPITAAADPVEAAKRVLDEIA